MSENNIKVSQNFIQDLKEETLQDLRFLENKLVEKINKKWHQMDETNNSLLEKLNKMMETNKQLFESMSAQKIILEKISDYEPFKNKIEAMVTTHGIRINTILTDFFNLRTKYDKIISDNLMVPGFIGPSCQFKTMSEYLLNQILENSKVKNEKEQIKSDVKECKNRVEGFLKNMVNLCDSSVLRCNKYTDTKEKNIKEYIQNALQNFEHKNLDMKARLYDKQEKMFEQLQNDMKEFDDVLAMKRDINEALHNKFKEYEKKFGKLNEKFSEKEMEIRNLSKELKQGLKSIHELNLTMKQILFKETANQMDIIKINAKLKKNSHISYSNDLNNLNNNTTNINSKINNDNLTTSHENYSPQKKTEIPNEGINLFKESILKGKSLINRRRGELFKDDLFHLKKKESKKMVLFKGQEKDNDEDNSDKENENKLYEQINFKKYVPSNEINYTITSDNLNIKKYNNEDSITSIKNKIIKNTINNTEINVNKNTIDNNKRVPYKRNSKSDYKKKKNGKFINLLKKNLNHDKNIDYYKLNFYPVPTDINNNNNNRKKYRTLKSDGFIASSSKISKGFNIKTLSKNFINKNKFNYKIVTIGDKISLGSDSKELYSLDFETLRKRSIRLNLVSPLSNTFKLYQNEKNRQNINNELNIKVSPAFGSTAYSFYQKNDFPNINNKNT